MGVLHHTWELRWNSKMRRNRGGNWNWCKTRENKTKQQLKVSAIQCWKVTSKDTFQSIGRLFYYARVKGTNKEKTNNQNRTCAAIMIKQFIPQTRNAQTYSTAGYLETYKHISFSGFTSSAFHFCEHSGVARYCPGCNLAMDTFLGLLKALSYDICLKMIQEQFGNCYHLQL